jgi:hypothetical protein
MSLGESRSRRLPIVADVWREYRQMGTTFPAYEDAEYLGELQAKTRQAPALGNPRSQASKQALSTWLTYESGLALHGQRPQQAFRHFMRASQAFGQAEESVNNFHLANTAHDVKRYSALSALLRSRTEASERQHNLQLGATIRGLGNLVIAGSEAARNVNGQGRSKLIGSLSETAMSGVLLVPDKQGASRIPAPATPRQNSPSTGNCVGAKTAIAHIQQASAFDINLLSYEGDNAEPSALTPIQVKTREPDEGLEGVYDPSIALLYSNRDLFVESLGEFAKLGRSLVHYASYHQINKTLATATSNVNLALELHAETAGGDTGSAE